MESVTIQSESPSTLATLAADALSHLEGLGYRESTISIYRGVWNALIRFSRDREDSDCISEELCDRFLASRGVPAGNYVGQLSSRKRQFRTAVRVLFEFSSHGSFRRRRRFPKTKVLRAPAFRQNLQEYLAFSENYLGHGHRTLRNRQYHLTDFLHFVESQGAQSLSSLSDLLVTQFFSRSH